MVLLRITRDSVARGPHADGSTCKISHGNLVVSRRSCTTAIVVFRLICSAIKHTQHSHFFKHTTGCRSDCFPCLLLRLVFGEFLFGRFARFYGWGRMCCGNGLVFAPQDDDFDGADIVHEVGVDFRRSVCCNYVSRSALNPSRREDRITSVELVKRPGTAKKGLVGLFRLFLAHTKVDLVEFWRRVSIRHHKSSAVAITLVLAIYVHEEGDPRRDVSF